MIKKSVRLPLLITFVVLIITIFLLTDVVDTGKKVVNRSTKAVGAEKTSLIIGEYVGKSACVDCHQRQHNLWLNSYHDLAMQEANDSTVLGDFNDVQFSHFGITSRFFRRNGEFFVETEGSDGDLHEYEISYTFGIIPLQQYLVNLPDGRVQVLPLCWDTRPAAKGGQRWFHIYPDERIAPDDELFWLGPNQNWNFMCAECHSTNLKKNYDNDSNSYNTTFSEINVSCEACHGPGSDHVAWAKSYEKSKKPAEKGDMGLKIRLKFADQGNWVFHPQSTTAQRNRPLKSNVLVEMCARCHSRRTALTDQYVHGKDLLATHRPRLIEQGMYFPDGQILEEVYVYDSFLQSKMHAKGVICTDCHEPHSTKVYAQDNTLCYRCHLHNTYGTREHHFHDPDSLGASCMECHMPERTYMVVDPRRDHSIRIPRPDLSQKLGTPNACNKCHTDKSAEWSTGYARKWYGEDFLNRPHFGQVFSASRKNMPGSRAALLDLVLDDALPTIVRASALLELQNFPHYSVVETINNLIQDNNPLIRFAAVQVSEMVNIENRWKLTKSLLQDTLMVIRQELASRLAQVPEMRMTDNEKKIRDKALDEYIACQLYNGERASSHLNLGVLYARLKKYDLVEPEYIKAIELEPYMPYAYINLADFYRSQNSDDLGEKILISGMEKIKNNADLLHALGLLYVRQKRIDEGMEYLQESAEIAPENPIFSYVYGVALSSTGQPQQAIRVLESTLQIHPYNEGIIQALATISRDAGLREKALKYAALLVRISPDNPGYQNLLYDLRSGD